MEDILLFYFCKLLEFVGKPHLKQLQMLRWHLFSWWTSNRNSGEPKFSLRSFTSWYEFGRSLIYIHGQWGLYVVFCYLLDDIVVKGVTYILLYSIRYFDFPRCNSTFSETHLVEQSFDPVRTPQIRVIKLLFWKLLDWYFRNSLCDFLWKNTATRTKHLRRKKNRLLQEHFYKYMTFYGEINPLMSKFLFANNFAFKWSNMVKNEHLNLRFWPVYNFKAVRSKHLLHPHRCSESINPYVSFLCCSFAFLPAGINGLKN